jgi:phage FluMu protein Com
MTLTKIVDAPVRMLRCLGCNKLLAELVTAPWRITCRGCGRISTAGDLDEDVTIPHTMSATP